MSNETLMSVAEELRRQLASARDAQLALEVGQHHDSVLSNIMLPGQHGAHLSYDRVPMAGSFPPSTQGSRIALQETADVSSGLHHARHIGSLQNGFVPAENAAAHGFSNQHHSVLQSDASSNLQTNDVMLTPHSPLSINQAKSVTAIEISSVYTVISIDAPKPNTSPSVETEITDQSANEDSSFSFTLPSNSFKDVDPGDRLSFTATLADGSPLPSWLAFDSATQSFSGTPTNDNVGDIIIQITATDGAGASATQDFHITIENTNDAPVATVQIADQFANEDTGFSFTVSPSSFSDIDVGDHMSFTATLSDGSPLPPWLIFDATTQSFTGTPLNDDVGNTSIKITATDSAGASATQVFNISIANTNDAPVITSPETSIILENLSGAVYQVSAVDMDAGTTLTYSLSGTDAALFNIDATTGLVTFIAPPDFEAPRDTGHNNIYDITVNASDGVATATRSVAITVNNVNEAPVVTSAATASLAENATGIVYTATATDPDAGTTLSFAIAGADAALFNIDSATGAVTFKSAPNFETPRDVGGNNIYDITVSASDGATTSTKDVVINVANVNEAPTIAISALPPAASTTSLSEIVLHVSGDHFQGAPIMRVSVDGAVVGTYTVTADHQTGGWQDVSITGDFGVAGPSHVKVEFTNDAYNGPGFDRNLIVDKITVNDVVFQAENADYHVGGGVLHGYETMLWQGYIDFNTAGAEPPSAAITVSENTSGTVLVALGTDPDAGAILTYSLSGTDATLFNINATTGELSFKSAPNYEGPTDAGSNNVYHVTISTSDGTYFASQTLAINVTNVNEGPTGITVTGPLAVQETVTSGGTIGMAYDPGQQHTVVATLNGVDPDSGDTLTYSILSGADGLFAMDGNQVTVAAGAILDYESAASHDITMRATDSAGHTFDKTITIATDNYEGRFEAKDGGVQVIGTSEEDTIKVGNGDDVLSGGAGADTLIGGEGSDTADYSTSESGVYIDLAEGKADGGDATGDRLDSIENITGSAFEDKLIGNEADNILQGRAGADHLAGGKGSDTTDYSRSESAVYVDLGNGKLDGGDATGDVLESVENITGSGFDDIFVGSNDDNTINGGAGNDTLILSGNYADYNITYDEKTEAYTLIDTRKGSPDATDTVTQVENFKFADVGITIKNPADLLNEAPVFTSDAASSFAENSKGPAYIAIAHDSDPGSSIAYSMSGTDAKLFNIDAVSGAVTFNSAPDYESAQDSGRDNVYDILVSASDGQNVTTQAVAIGVTNVNEASTSIALSGPQSVQETVASGGTIGSAYDPGSARPVVATLTANDPDAGDKTTYSIVGGATNLFAINGNQIKVAAGATFDYETTPSYSLVVRATDSSGNSYDQSVKINIGNYAGAYAGTSGNDTVTGTSEEDVISGGAGNDRLSGGAGNDVLDGGEGDDILVGGTGNDAFIGGSGLDTVDYSAATENVSIAFSATDQFGVGGYYKNSAAGGFGGEAVGDTFASIEAFTGTNYADIIGGGSVDMTFVLGGGNDVFDTNIAYSVADVVYGGSGNDTMWTGAGDDSLYGSSGDDYLNGEAGTDTAFYNDATSGITLNLSTTVAQNTGGAGVDTIFNIENLVGSAFADTLTGTSGNNVISGGAGNDIIIGGAGADTLSGDTGTDTLSYAGSTAGVAINLATNTASGGDAGGDVVSGFENVTGGSGNDMLTATNSGSTLDGGGGNDVLIGGNGNDLIYGGTGDDLVQASGGTDTIDGGTGSDTIDYSVATGDITINLTQGLGYYSNYQAGADHFSSFENAIGGSANDTLIGSSLDNVLAGGAGNDSFFGGAGNDTMSGGSGADLFFLQAGLGNDTVSGGAGGGWIDAIDLHDAAGNSYAGAFPNDWTLVLTQGSIVATGNETMTLSNDASGYVQHSDGTHINFAEIEQIRW